MQQHAERYEWGSLPTNLPRVFTYKPVLCRRRNFRRFRYVIGFDRSSRCCYVGHCGYSIGQKLLNGALGAGIARRFNRGWFVAVVSVLSQTLGHFQHHFSLPGVSRGCSSDRCCLVSTKFRCRRSAFILEPGDCFLIRRTGYRQGSRPRPDFQQHHGDG